MSENIKRKYDESDYCDIELTVAEFGKIIGNRIDDETEFDENEYDEDDIIREFRVYMNVTKCQIEVESLITNKTIKIFKSLKAFTKYYIKKTKNETIEGSQK